jgi:hypothetical protein
MVHLTYEQRQKLLMIRVEVMRRVGYTVKMVEAERERSRKLLMRTDEEIREQSSYMRLEKQLEKYREEKRLREMPSWYRWLRKTLLGKQKKTAPYNP